MWPQDPKYFGQPIVILNKPGAGGMTGWNWIMERGSKDGLTMTAYNMPHFIAQSIVNKTKFSVDTFEPLGNWGADPAVLIVPKDSKFKNVADLVAFAKENPGKVTINGAGLYVGHHIATLQLQKATRRKDELHPGKGRYRSHPERAGRQGAWPVSITLPTCTAHRIALPSSPSPT